METPLCITLSMDLRTWLHTEMELVHWPERGSFLEWKYEFVGDGLCFGLSTGWLHGKG